MTTKPTETVDPIDHTKLAKIEADWSSAYAALEALPCDTSVEQRTWWGTKLSQAQDVVAELEGERQNLVRPLIDDKTRIDKLFKKTASAPEKVKELAKTKLAAAAEAVLQLEQEAREVARRAAEAGDTDAVQEALSNVAEVVSIAGASTGFVWEVDKIDTKALPKEYWVVDYARLDSIATEARKSETAPVVPGVTFKRVARISARRGKK